MAAPPDDDMLREAARARGFRLVKSRRRKPGGDFGRYGLVGLDSGRECLGFEEGGLTATAEEVLAYLRGGEVASWKRSLIGVVRSDTPARPQPPPTPVKAGAQQTARRSAGAPQEVSPAPSRTPAQAGAQQTARRSAAAQTEIPPKPSRTPAKAGAQQAARTNPDPATAAPAPPDPGLRRGAGAAKKPTPPASTPTIRQATRRDAAALAKLLDIPAAALAERLAAALRADEPPLVAERDGRPVGLIAWTVTATLQHGPRGRITLLVVAEGKRRQGTGTRLLAEAEQRLLDAGIFLVELSLDIDFDAPTAFVRRAGFTRTTNGFAKPLGK